jgi:hypothetical protein
MFATPGSEFFPVTIPPYENQNQKCILLGFDANHGDQMRKETPAGADGKSAGYTIFFQIANDGGRRACCAKVEALNIQEASALFRQNWPVIESMARDGVVSRVIGEHIITLVMP